MDPLKIDWRYLLEDDVPCTKPVEPEPPMRKMLKNWGFDFWSEVNSKEEGITTTYTSPDGGYISIHYKNQSADGKEQDNMAVAHLLLPYVYPGQKRESISINSGNGLKPLESHINGLLAFNRYLQKSS